MLLNKYSKLFLFSLALISFLSFNTRQVLAAPLKEGQSINIDASYDEKGRSKLSVHLLNTSNDAYFYIDQDYWNRISNTEREAIRIAILNVAGEFDSRIHPILNRIYGGEWSPGIDGDKRVFFVFHSMRNNAAGYFREKDQYPRVQLPSSNEKEILYLNIDYLASKNFKSYLAHEFTHLIIFNQKNRLLDTSEEVWLTEMIAEYSPTLVGYNDSFKDSYLEKRVKRFVEDPSYSLLDWKNETLNYGASSLFVHYLVDQYGIKTLSDVLHTQKVGILAVNESLANRKINKTFNQIFVDWTVTNYANNCQLGERYCYKFAPLRDVKISPQINFLPNASSNFSFYDSMESWAAKWYKIVGGSNKLTFEISSNSGKFNVPYLLEKSDGTISVNYLSKDNEGKMKLSLDNFSQQYKSLTIIPSRQDSSSISPIDFSWSVMSSKQSNVIIETPISKPPAIINGEPVFTVQQREFLIQLFKLLLQRLLAQG